MARRNQPYFPLYVQDFITDEKLNECSAASAGVYIRLMCLMHKSEEYGKILLKQKDKQNESKILNFASKLVRQMPYDVDTIFNALDELLNEGVISIDGDVLFQKRMVRDAELSEKRSVSGSKRGSASQDKNLLKQKDKQNESKSKANSENEIEDEDENEDKRKGNSTGRGKESLETSFEKFWELYPRKVAKATARKAWAKIRPDDFLLEKILNAVEKAQKTSQWQEDEGKYIPYPATWLNREGWNDEIDIKHPSAEFPVAEPIPAELPPGKTWADVYGDKPAEITPGMSWEDLVE